VGEWVVREGTIESGTWEGEYWGQSPPRHAHGGNPAQELWRGGGEQVGVG
jgi:hypothetical protein